MEILQWIGPAVLVLVTVGFLLFWSREVDPPSWLALLFWLAASGGAGLLIALLLGIPESMPEAMALGSGTAAIQTFLFGFGISWHLDIEPARRRRLLILAYAVLALTWNIVPV